jgi:hypothetical protein
MKHMEYECQQNSPRALCSLIYIKQMQFLMRYNLLKTANTMVDKLKKKKRYRFY